MVTIATQAAGVCASASRWPLVPSSGVSSDTSALLAVLTPHKSCFLKTGSLPRIFFFFLFLPETSVNGGSW